MTSIVLPPWCNLEAREFSRAINAQKSIHSYTKINHVVRRPVNFARHPYLGWAATDFYYGRVVL